MPDGDEKIQKLIVVLIRSKIKFKRELESNSVIEVRVEFSPTCEMSNVVHEKDQSLTPSYRKESNFIVLHD